MRGVPGNPVPCETCGLPGYRFQGGNRCLSHRPPTKRLKYPFDAQKDAIVRAAYQSAGNRQKLKLALNDATRRIGYPRHIIRMRAQRMGMTYDTRHKWEVWEEEYLATNCGVVPIKAMQKKLGHAHSAIMAKIFSMGMRYAIKEGMTKEELGQALGVCHRTVSKWMDEGLLRAIGTTRRFSESRVRAFINTHPELYDLRRVNQEWFKAMLFPGAACFVAKLGTYDRPISRANGVEAQA